MTWIVRGCAHLLAVFALAGCGGDELLVHEDPAFDLSYSSEGEFESEPVDDRANVVEQGLVSCTPSQHTGYEAGRPYPITVVNADGKPAEVNTANAYALMQAAAARAGVRLRVVSGFRSQQEQQYLYSCYVNCSCNGCNLAARPGYSNHQSGEALDLNTRDPGVYNWLANNAGRFGFRRTVAKEPWHWEYRGGQVSGGPCSAHGGAASATNTAAVPRFVGLVALPHADGYWLAKSEGGVFSHRAPFHGSAGGLKLAAPVVAFAGKPDGSGYWLASTDGGVFSFGAAGFHGSLGHLKLNAPIVGMAASPDGNGYWLVSADGGVFSFGSARFFGSMGGVALNRPIVGMAATMDGGGYWLVAADGGIFSFGNAAFHGSMGGVALAQPIVGIARSASGNGYWLASKDGGVFSFGDAAFGGSAAGLALKAPISAIAANPTGHGYWLVGEDGGVFSFGGAPFHGSGG